MKTIWYNGIAAQYPLAYPNVNGTTVTITGIAPGTAFLWGVSALDAAGNVSTYDNLPSLVVNPVPAPAAVSAVATPPAAGGFQFAVQAGAVQTTFGSGNRQSGRPGVLGDHRYQPARKDIHLHGHQFQPVPDALLPRGQPVIWTTASRARCTTGFGIIDFRASPAFRGWMILASFASWRLNHAPMRAFLAATRPLRHHVSHSF